MKRYDEGARRERQDEVFLVVETGSHHRSASRLFFEMSLHVYVRFGCLCFFLPLPPPPSPQDEQLVS